MINVALGWTGERLNFSQKCLKETLLGVRWWVVWDVLHLSASIGSDAMGNRIFENTENADSKW